MQLANGNNNYFKGLLLAGLVFTTFSLEAVPWYLLPVDKVAISTQMGFVLISILYNFYHSKDRQEHFRRMITPYFICLIVLLCVVIIFIFLSSFATQVYGVKKIAYFIIKVILPLFALSTFWPLGEKDFKIMFFVVMFGAILTSLNLSILNSITIERSTITGINPITVARVIGLGVIILLLYLYYEKHSLLRMIGVFAVALVLLFTVFSTGSRGPLLAIFLAYILSGILDKNFKIIFNKKFISILLGILIFSVCILRPPTSVQSEPINMGTDRISTQIDSIGTSRSDRNRIERYKISLLGFYETYGFGIGTGGFTEYYASKSPKQDIAPGYDYSHNLFLEIALEQGIAGLTALFVLLLMTLKTIIKVLRFQNVYIKCVVSLWFYTLMNAMVSADIAGNYAFWILGGLIALTPFSKGESVTPSGSAHA